MCRKYIRGLYAEMSAGSRSALIQLNIVVPSRCPQSGEEVVGGGRRGEEEVNVGKDGVRIGL